MLHYLGNGEKGRMDIHKALDQISEIHGHLVKTDVYRGYRAVPVALSGVLALAAAAVQTRIIGNGAPRSFVLYWAVVALLGCATAAGGIIYSYVHQESQLARRRTRITVGQLIPCVVAGIGLTAMVTRSGSKSITLLPGLWTVLFSLGVFASRPYLPRIIGWVALYYLVAGTILLAMAEDGTSLSPWGIGLTFGFGQIMAGIVLYWNLERKGVR